MELKDLDKKLQIKIKNKQKYITSNYDLHDFGYIKSGTRRGYQEWRIYIPQSQKTLKEKIKNKQKFITSDIDLRKFGYAPVGYHKNSRVWCYYTYKTDRKITTYNTLEEKIRNQQRITTNNDLSEFGFIPVQISRNGTKIWARKKSKSLEEKINANQKYITTDVDLSKFGYVGKNSKWRLISYQQEIHKKYYMEHKEELRKKNRAYRKTSKGRIAIIQGSRRHKEKDVIQLFGLEGIALNEIDFHHLSPNLPYVIPIPREIHRSIGGRNPNHYLGVIAKFYGWLEENPQIKIVEIN